MNEDNDLPIWLRARLDEVDPMTSYCAYCTNEAMEVCSKCWKHVCNQHTQEKFVASVRITYCSNCGADICR